MVPPFIVDGWRFLDIPPPPRKKDSEGKPMKIVICCYRLKISVSLFFPFVYSKQLERNPKHHGEPHVVWILLEKSHQETSCLISLEKGHMKNLGFVGISEQRCEVGTTWSFTKNGLTPKWWGVKWWIYSHGTIQQNITKKQTNPSHLCFLRKILSWSLLPVNRHILNRFSRVGTSNFFFEKVNPQMTNALVNMGVGRFSKNMKLPNGQNAGSSWPNSFSMATTGLTTLFFQKKSFLDTLFFLTRCRWSWK